MRHLGIVRLLTILSPDLGRRCISYIKAMAGMDLAETRRPLDGRWVRQADGASRVDLRISTIPTLYGEDLTLRLLVCQNEAQGLDSLGMSTQNLSDLHWMLSSPSGLILVTGPTGSGKTTTLYACLRHLNDGQRKINTIEDPIEYAVSGLRQSQVNLKADVGFPELLRSILRQTPDIIMIGEIRDPVTAETAVHAASSGQLVLATLHAPIAAGAVQSDAQPGRPSPLPVQLAPGRDRPAAGPRALPGTARCGSTSARSRRRSTRSAPGSSPARARRSTPPRAARECHQTGYASRTGVFEVLRITRELRRLIAEGQPTRALRQKADGGGLRRAPQVGHAQGGPRRDQRRGSHPRDPVGISGHRGVTRPDGPTGAGVRVGRLAASPGGGLIRPPRHRLPGRRFDPPRRRRARQGPGGRRASPRPAAVGISVSSRPRASVE